MSTDKSLWVCTRTDKRNPDRTWSYYIRAATIRDAHAAGRKLFGERVSFSTRKPNKVDIHIARDRDVIEV
jgi:hypothetical protein